MGSVARPEIAYHFRRLVAESLAEISPEDEDWPLVRRLFSQEQELFRRMFVRIEGDAWWKMLLDHWLPSLSLPSSDGQWYSLLVSRLDRWMNTHPVEVVALWRRALSEGWGEGTYLVWQITSQVQKFSRWDTEGVPKLLGTLLVENKGERDFLGKALSLYTEATNQGDELLWRYIIRDVDPGAKGSDRWKQLHCAPHVFHGESLGNRLIRSGWLLDAAISALEEWAIKDNGNSDRRRLTSIFLHHSSWEYRHSHYDTHHPDGLKVILTGVEQAFKYHAQTGDEWWQEREPQLRSASEETLLYFLTLAYKENPEANVEGIAALLTNAELFHYCKIENELGELIQTGYHLLSPDIQELNQETIFELSGEEDWGEEGVPVWVYRIIYDYLIWIPSIFRLPASQRFIDQFSSQILVHTCLCLAFILGVDG